MADGGEAIEVTTPSGVTGLERAYFGVITVAALFVSWLGFFNPARMDESFTWALLPPLHARFVAALYLFGAVYMGACAVARHRAQVTPGPPAVIIFTSLLLLVTLLNLEAFDFDLGPPWVWTVSYIVYPLLGVALIAWTRGRPSVEPPGPPLPALGRTALQVQAVVYGVSGVLLLVARGLMVDLWPWPISNGLAQFYGGPFLAIAYCCWRYCTRRQVVSVAPLAVGMLAFTAATFAVSVKHQDILESGPATWLWFAWFGAGAVAAAALIWALLGDGRQSTAE